MLLVDPPKRRVVARPAARDIHREMQEVGKLQRSLLPGPLRRIPGLELAASYKTTGPAGGDLYDFFPLDAGRGRSKRWCLFIGDAAGHSVAASVVIAIVQAILHAHPVPAARPAELLAHINRQLCRKQLEGFVTCFLAFFEPGTRQLTYASAGHPPPLMKSREDRAVSRLDAAGGCPLGIDASLAFTEASLQPGRGDTLLLYTDGITEARGREGEWFGIERLERALQSAGRRPSQAIRTVCDLISDYQDSETPIDDQTMVVARVS